MLRFWDVRELVDYINTNLVPDDLNGVRGSYYINDIVFHDLKVSNSGNEVLVSVTTTYQVFVPSTRKFKEIKKKNIVAIENKEEMLEYLFSFISKDKRKENKQLFSEILLLDQEFTTEIIKLASKRKVLESFNNMSNIALETKNSAIEEETESGLTYIEGSRVIKDVSLKKDIEISIGSLTRFEVDLCLKQLEKRYALEFRNAEQKNKNPRLTSEQIACRRVSDLLVMRITDTNGKANIYFTGQHPAEIQKKHQSLVKFEMFKITNYFLQYKTKQIATKKELEDLIYNEHKSK